MSNDQAIAILDSGVGGLTVVKEVMRQLPLERIIYFGDTARAPYGPRSPEEVLLFTRQIVDYLMQFHPKMIVIACNTATAAAIDDIRSHVNIPVLGVISPGVRAALQQTVNGHIGVIGTEGTIRSGAYEAAIRNRSPHVRVVSQSCPSFVPLVEKGLFRSEDRFAVVDSALRELKKEPIDTLILGCTHYPFLADTIQQCMGPQVALISSADHTARDIAAALDHSGQLALPGKLPLHRFFCSGDSATFRQIAQDWLDELIYDRAAVWQVPIIH